MGNPNINEEDKNQTLMIHVKGYILDNIKNDPDAIKQIQEFIKSKWGIKDIEKYNKKRFEFLERKLENSRLNLSELNTKFDEKSWEYKMISQGLIKQIQDLERDLALIKRA
ncbi:hypothetical protein BSK48_14115 [Paenibacillus odorifer]|uniref:hypothetical protein n=1 Tax=Paenibacillus odorifer TaxID=189426 RepID=UPI00096D2AF1|nr:hypothetical protein [Paenibacillus odorifer]OMD70886.1 hypothetical protein BSK48_14115 [Paenibacillus odorifer]